MRYILSYIDWQDIALGDDDGYLGWQSFYTHEIFSDLETATKAYRKVSENAYKKDVWLAEEKDVSLMLPKTK